MPAYFVADIEVTDPEGYEAYRRDVIAVVQRAGGRYLIRGGPVDALEGGWNPGRLVVIEFPTMEAARRWYDSDDYRRLLAIRNRTARSRVVLVEGD